MKKCPRCKVGEDTVEHWLHECDKMKTVKEEVFTRATLEKDILTREPGKSLLLARKTILQDVPLGSFRSESS